MLKPPEGAPGLVWRSMVRMARRKIRRAAPAMSGLWRRKGRKRLGTERTHCLMGRWGST